MGRQVPLDPAAAAPIPRANQLQNFFAADRSNHIDEPTSDGGFDGRSKRQHR